MDSSSEHQSRRKLNFDDVHESPAKETEVHTEISSSIEIIHSKLSENEIPTVGMEFNTEQAAYDFYNSYARKVGFSCRRSSVHYDRKGNLLDRTICCSCEGRKGKDKRRDVEYTVERPNTRFGCLAMMKINVRHTGKYRIDKFIAEHTHVLASPSKSFFGRSHRSINLVQAAEIELSDASGIAPKAGYELMARRAGGRENLGFIHKDYKNYLRTKRTIEMKEGDAGRILEYLQKMHSDDPNFFSAIQLDEADQITNIFWADGKMMIDFARFGDVVCFDTTYKKNRDGRPFGLFVGVNHHKQTIIFGAVLLYSETIKAFEWLFDTFTTAMSGKRPMTILTDQDSAMASAIASQWPDTYHRLCIWHIYQNAATHLKGTFSRYHDFAKEFSSCVYEYDEEVDFLSAWDNMLDKFDLKENDWLKRLFDLREKWALVYGRQTFCADMSSTQRSESMNGVLKKYVSYKHDLMRFFEHFQRLVDDRRFNEAQADYKASQTSPAMSSYPVAILKHAASVYTPSIFDIFKLELFKSYDSDLQIESEVDVLSTYKVKPYSKNYHHTVVYDTSKGTIRCSCRKFEFAGILCSHALKVLSMKKILRIPQTCILKRWTKNAKSGNFISTYQVGLSEDPKVMMGNRYKDLCWLYMQLASRAAESENTYEMAKIDGLKLLQHIDGVLGNKKDKEHVPGASREGDDLLEGIQVSYEKGNLLEGDKRIKRVKVKEKPSNKSGKRIKSGIQKNSRKKKLPPKETQKLHEENIRDSQEYIASVSRYKQERRMGDTLQNDSAVLSYEYPRRDGSQNTYSGACGSNIDSYMYDLSQQDQHSNSVNLTQDWIPHVSPFVQPNYVSPELMNNHQHQSMLELLQVQLQSQKCDTDESTHLKFKNP